MIPKSLGPLEFKAEDGEENMRGELVIRIEDANRLLAERLEKMPCGKGRRGFNREIVLLHRETGGGALRLNSHPKRVLKPGAFFGPGFMSICG